MHTIQAIGWGRYIVAMIIYWVISMVLFVLIGLLTLVPDAGVAIYWIVFIIIIVPYIIFSARYLALVYESATPVTPVPPAAILE
jgi:hypothetical protein